MEESLNRITQNSKNRNPKDCKGSHGYKTFLKKTQYKAKIRGGFYYVS